MLSMKMTIFVAKVRTLLHNLAYGEIVCYVFFKVGCDPSVLLLLLLMCRRTFRLFSCAETSLEKYFEFGKSLVMPPTNGTQH